MMVHQEMAHHEANNNPMDNNHCYDEHRLLLNSKQTKASMKSSVFAGVCSTIGGGMLSLPFAFQGTGIVLGVAVLIGAQAITIVSCRMLIECAKLVGEQASYVDIVKE
jgi:amino acid permease